MNVHDGLRNSRLGRLKYDTDWLESGRKDDILALCNSFDRSLSISVRDARAMGLSVPKSDGDGNKSAPPVLRTNSNSFKNEIFGKGDTESSKFEQQFFEPNVTPYELAMSVDQENFSAELQTAVDDRLKRLQSDWEEHRRKFLFTQQKGREFQNSQVSPIFTPSSVEIYSENDSENAPIIQGHETAQDFSDLELHFTPPEEQDVNQCPDIFTEEDQLSQSETENSEENFHENQSDNFLEESIRLSPTEADALNEQEVTAFANSVACNDELSTFSFKIEKTMDGVSKSTHEPPPTESPIHETEEVNISPSAMEKKAEPLAPRDSKENGLSGEGNALPVTDTPIDIQRSGPQSRSQEYIGTVDTSKRLKQWYAQFQNSIAPIAQGADRVAKTLRMAYTKVISMPFNVLSAENTTDCLAQLTFFLKGGSAIVQGQKLDIFKHPIARKYCFDLVVKRLVKRVEACSAEPAVIALLSRVAINLWLDFPLLGTLLTAVVQERCPYLIPYYIPREQGQSDNDYLKALGYLYDNNILEKHPNFLGRMSGICRFWASLCIEPMPSRFLRQRTQYQPSAQHPLGCRASWKFLSDFLLLAPRTDITATILFDYLQIVGPTFKKVYGRQYKKLILFIRTNYLPDVLVVSTNGSGQAAYTRLQNFLK